MKPQNSSFKCVHTATLKWLCTFGLGLLTTGATAAPTPEATQNWIKDKLVKYATPERNEFRFHPGTGSVSIDLCTLRVNQADYRRGTSQISRYTLLAADYQETNYYSARYSSGWKIFARARSIENYRTSFTSKSNDPMMGRDPDSETVYSLYIEIPGDFSREQNLLGRFNQAMQAWKSEAATAGCGGPKEAF